MSITEPPKSRFLFGFIVGAAIAATTAAIVARIPVSKQRTESAASFIEGYDFSDLRIEGYDFSDLRRKDNVWGGPQIGERIDISNLISREGTNLETIMDKRPAMIVAVSPSCGLCKTARDEMQYVQSQMAFRNVRFYLVSFTQASGSSDFYAFCDTLKLGVPGFQWSRDAAPPQEALSRMVTPTHTLIDYDGTILRVWPGSSAQQSVRDRMGRQIVNDVSVAIETLGAVSPKPSVNH